MSKRRSVRNVELTPCLEQHPDFPSVILTFSGKCTSAGFSSFEIARLNLTYAALACFCDAPQII